MNDCEKNYTVAEQGLMERFVQFDEEKLNPEIQSVMKEYGNRVFIKDIFAIIVEDVFRVLSLTKWNKTSLKKLIKSADAIVSTTDWCTPVCDWFEMALVIVWITYCCKYKSKYYILDSASAGKINYKDARLLEYSILAEFFNVFGGPAIGKMKLLEKYMDEKYGENDYCIKDHNDYEANCQTLLHFLSVMNFSYNPMI